MKRKFETRNVFLVVGACLFMLAGPFLQPMKEMPVPDFNDIYDPAIL